MKNETKLNIFILVVLIVGGLLLAGLMYLFRNHTVGMIVTTLILCIFFIIGSNIKIPRDKKWRMVYRLIFYPITAVVYICAKLIKPSLAIISASMLAVIVSLVPVFILIVFYTFFCGRPSIELTLFGCICISSILLSNHIATIKKVLRFIGIWGAWEKNKHQHDFVKIGEYVLQSGNMHFVVSFLYVVFLSYYAYQSITGHNIILSPSIDNAILQSFLVYLAYTALLKRYVEQEISTIGMAIKILRMFGIEADSKKENKGKGISE